MSPNQQQALDLINKENAAGLADLITRHPELVQQDIFTLEWAVQTGRLECVMVMFAHVPDAHLDPSMLWAASTPNPDILIAVLDEQQRRSDLAPTLLPWLQSAVMLASPINIDLLVKRGGRGLLCDLWLAAGAGDVPTVASFFDDNGDLVPGTGQHRQSYGEYGDWPEYELSNDPDEIKSAAFCHACACGRIPAMDYLVDEQGVDINAAPSPGMPGLHFAAMEGRFDVVRHLVNQGASLIHAAGYSQYTCWGLALTHGHEAISNFLIDQGLTLTLHEAVMAGRVDLIEDALGEDPATVYSLDATWHDHECHEQTTPLHTAAYYDRPEITRLLLDRGADPATRSAEGQTAIEVAQSFLHDRVVEVLNVTS
jgi:hypothetical protein